MVGKKPDQERLGLIQSWYNRAGKGFHINYISYYRIGKINCITLAYPQVEVIIHISAF